MSRSCYPTLFSLMVTEVNLLPLQVLTVHCLQRLRNMHWCQSKLDITSGASHHSSAAPTRLLRSLVSFADWCVLTGSTWKMICTQKFSLGGDQLVGVLKEGKMDSSAPTCFKHILQDQARVAHASKMTRR